MYLFRFVDLNTVRWANMPGYSKINYCIRNEDVGVFITDLQINDRFFFFSIIFHLI